MDNLVKYRGKIVFDPEDKTNKHMNQASWKRMAMVLLEPDLKSGEKGITDYYAWFIEKRYNLKLNRPIRGAHISFINDSVRDMGEYADQWDAVKEKWDGKEIDIYVNLDARTDASEPGSSGHWWMHIPEEYRTELHAIRAELGLGRPYYGLHMSIGYANEKNIEHAAYIHALLKKYGGNYN